MTSKYNTLGSTPKQGGYRNLISYQKAEIIYDGTVYFTNRFYRKTDRTIEQMVQAAHNGKQNIAEASMASDTSKETEIKLTNAAKASLEELMLDYEDFLRTRKLPIWEKEHPFLARVRRLNRRTPNATYKTYIKAIENGNPEICANSMIYLVKTATYLLAKQIQQLEKDFLENGGLRENTTKIQSQNKNNE
jgi:four helix bundle suffix protein